MPGPVTLYLVRHGRSTMDRDTAAHTWGLDPVGHPEIDELRTSGRLPADALWFTSPEPKTRATARRLTGREVEVVDDLREHERHSTAWLDDFPAVVRRAFDHPAQPAHAGWEPLARTRERVVGAVRRLLEEHPGRDLVLVGHGTAWTVLRSELTGEPPDLDAWARLRMPDVWVLEPRAV